MTGAYKKVLSEMSYYDFRQLYNAVVEENARRNEELTGVYKNYKTGTPVDFLDASQISGTSLRASAIVGGRV